MRWKSAKKPRTWKVGDIMVLEKCAEELKFERQDLDRNQWTQRPIPVNGTRVLLTKRQIKSCAAKSFRGFHTNTVHYGPLRELIVFTAYDLNTGAEYELKPADYDSYQWKRVASVGSSAKTDS